LRLSRAAACTPPELCAAASASTITLDGSRNLAQTGQTSRADIRIIAFHRRQQQRPGGSVSALRQGSDEDDLACGFRAGISGWGNYRGCSGRSRTASLCGSSIK
jgi:hypothetical protein